MSRMRKLQLLGLVLVPAATGAGYLLGLAYQWLGWSGRDDPWHTALTLGHGTAFAVACVLEGERRYIKLARTPADYVRDRGLETDHDRLLWLLIATTTLITVAMAAVAWDLPAPPDPVFLGITGLTAACFWGGIIWAAWRGRREVAKTGRHASASGSRQVARAELSVATEPEHTQTAVSRAAKELGFSVLAERGRTLWLRPPLRTRGFALAVRLDLEPSPRGTMMRACCFPTSRWAGKSAAVGVEVLVSLLDATAERALWLPRRRFSRPAAAEG